MKKVLAISFLTFYGFLAMGLQLHVHLCCGNLHSVGFVQTSCCHHGDDHQSDHECSFDGQCCDFVAVDLSLKDFHRVPAPLEVLATVDFETVTITIHQEVADNRISQQHFEPLRGSPPSYPPIYATIESRIFYS